MISRRRPRFFVPHDAVVADRVVLRGDEHHHLRVRRVGPGEHVELFDDLGRIFDGVVRTVTVDCTELAVTTCDVPARESPLDLTLAIGLLKASKLDLAVEKATELGVTRIVLFTSERTLGGSSPARLQRLRRIAVSAAKQSGRRLVPSIEGPEPLTAIADRSAALRLVCSEQAEVAAAWPQEDKASSVIVAVGPEGGFTKEEVATLQQASFRAVSLGPRILRGETAAIAIVALVQGRWGDLGSKVAQVLPAS